MVSSDEPRGGNGGRIAWNLFGFALPLAIAAAAIPQLLSLIGSERFGYLALAWGVIGYASVIDLGIGRAATRLVSCLRGGGHRDRIPDVVASAAWLTRVTGAIGMLALVAAAWLGAHRLVPSAVVPERELQLALLFLALALPMQAMSATWRGVNEAWLNFAPVNLLRVLLGAANFGGPWLVALFVQDLHWLVATLVVSRAAALACYRGFALRCLRRAGLGTGRFAAGPARQLLHFGGWHSLSSLLNPLLVQADRFLIGALVSAAAVTAYVIPYELAVQCLVLSGAVTSVAFPLISQLLQSDAERAACLFRSWQRRLGLAMAVAMGTLAWFMPDLLHVWLQGRVPGESVVVGRILCAGVFFNSVGAMYFALLHAQGKTRQTALLHLLEVPPYLVLLWLLIGQWGVVGAALAWSMRVSLDAAALACLCRDRASHPHAGGTRVPALR
ncbi:oligosaccharide flippase family protein [Noviherbaspirillum aridicola]|uniref:O-antigen/teichoic acid export membrane protein n=1 Tax=Noviherbaspirillum aridicola TaxID=2849687 RepID=A0ABQ4Q350_9BURK|nr:oligosaccharide flippase family protein [Noviherbaspirillum aridicola]GIZ51616.1 hypothetical protein NCCP691_16300 [Noviherbaspirillum aridicola]